MTTALPLGGRKSPGIGTWTLDFDPARVTAVDLAARRARARVVGRLALVLFNVPGRLLTAALGTASVARRPHRRA